MALSYLHALASINLKADQTISGTAINMLSTALTMFLAQTITGSGNITIVRGIIRSDIPLLSSIPVLGPLFFSQTYWTTWLCLGIWGISYFLLYRTNFGLRLRACGEHPQAADSVGINVYQWRYTGVIISGALGGIGGFAYIVPSVTTWNFEVGVAGAGFLALAVMIFGQWKPFHIAGAAVFFAVFRSLANIADSTVLSHLGLSKNIYSMMPFIASMIILAFTSKNSQAPKAEGIPYDKGAR